MIGTCARSALRRRAISKPSMSGSITSRTSRSGLKLATASSELRASPADSTVNPWNRSAIEITSAMLGSSSTTSTRWLSGVAVVITLLSVGAVPQRFLGACPEPPARTRWRPRRLGTLAPVVRPPGRVGRRQRRPAGPRGAVRAGPVDEVVEVRRELLEDAIALGGGQLLVGHGLVELLGDARGDRRLDVVQALALVLGDVGDALAGAEPGQQIVELEAERGGRGVQRAAGAGLEAQAAAAGAEGGMAGAGTDAGAEHRAVLLAAGLDRVGLGLGQLAVLDRLVELGVLGGAERV